MANLRGIMMCLVGVKTYGVRPKIFIITINIKSEISPLVLLLYAPCIRGVSNSIFNLEIRYCLNTDKAQENENFLIGKSAKQTGIINQPLNLIIPLGSKIENKLTIIVT